MSYVDYISYISYMSYVSYISKVNSDCENQIILLMIPNEEK